jgi:hypothetical protein
MNPITIFTQKGNEHVSVQIFQEVDRIEDTRTNSKHPAIGYVIARQTGIGSAG